MAIQKGDKRNFDTILQAAKRDELALLECIEAKTGQQRSVICAINRTNEQYEFVPLAVLFAENPYEVLTPPTVGA
jgi:Family of unknown function (DUF6117)